VGAIRVRGPFVTDERGEAAGRAAVIGLLGGALDILPEAQRLGVAVAVIRAAESGRRRGIGDGILAPRLTHRGRGPAVELTLRRVVSRRPWGRADVDLAEELRMVGDYGKVHGPGLLRADRRVAGRVHDVDRTPLGVAVGIAGTVDRADGD